MHTGLCGSGAQTGSRHPRAWMQEDTGTGAGKEGSETGDVEGTASGLGLASNHLGLRVHETLWRCPLS